jgi:hypothetical protein
MQSSCGCDGADCCGARGPISVWRPQRVALNQSAQGRLSGSLTRKGCHRHSSSIVRTTLCHALHSRPSLTSLPSLSLTHLTHHSLTHLTHPSLTHSSLTSLMTHSPHSPHSLLTHRLSRRQTLPCPSTTATSARGLGPSHPVTTAGPSLTVPLRGSRQHWALQHWGALLCSVGQRCVHILTHDFVGPR